MWYIKAIVSKEITRGDVVGGQAIYSIVASNLLSHPIMSLHNVSEAWDFSKIDEVIRYALSQLIKSSKRKQDFNNRWTEQ